jgi:hypothetical protein
MSPPSALRRGSLSQPNLSHSVMRTVVSSGSDALNLLFEAANHRDAMESQEQGGSQAYGTPRSGTSYTIGRSLCYFASEHQHTWASRHWFESLLKSCKWFLSYANATSWIVKRILCCGVTCCIIFLAPLKHVSWPYSVTDIDTRPRWRAIISLHLQSAACTDVTTFSRDTQDLDVLPLCTNGMVFGP